MIVEIVGYNPRGANVYDVLHVFGNCLTTGGPGCENDDFLPRVENIDEVEGRDEPEIYRGATPIIVRGHLVHVDVAAGDELCDVFRLLVPEHRELLLADEDEQRRRIPNDLPEVLRLDDWHRPDLLDTRPSASEVFSQLATVMATNGTHTVFG